MSALRELIEVPEGSQGGRLVGRCPTPDSLMFVRLAPFRAEAIRLGFTLLKRDCDRAEGGRRRCVDTFVHVSGIWLDLVGNVDARLSFGPTLAKFRTWAAFGCELIEVATVAATPLWRSRMACRFFGILERMRDDDLRTHPLRSPADLAFELVRHQSVLRNRGLAPLLAGDDALEDRGRWQLSVRRSLRLIAPP